MEKKGNKYFFSDFEKDYIYSLLMNKYGEIKGVYDNISDIELYAWIKGQCENRRIGIADSTIKRLCGKDNWDDSFTKSSVEKLFIPLSIRNIDDFENLLREYSFQNHSDLKPLSIFSLFAPHLLEIRLENELKMQINYIGNDRFKVQVDEINKIQKGSSILLFRFAIGQPFWFGIYEEIKQDGEQYTKGSDLGKDGIIKTIVFKKLIEKNKKYPLENISFKDIILGTDESPLIQLPKKPTAFWYNSAGIDFRGPVFFNPDQLKNLKNNHNKNLKNPDLFLFNCIGQEVIELRNKLKNNEAVTLYNDGTTKIMGTNFFEFNLNEDLIDYIINPKYIEFAMVQMPKTNKHAFYFDVIISSGYDTFHKHKILYFEMENINFFEQIIRSNIFEVLYHCSTNEGMAWGGCRKSVLKYIYEEHNPTYFAKQGYRPEILFFNGGTANDALKFADSNSELSLYSSRKKKQEYTKTYLNYYTKRTNSENGHHFDTDVVKINYPARYKMNQSLKY